jgi:hypothetical protein
MIGENIAELAVADTPGKIPKSFECDQKLWNGFGCVARALLVQHNQNRFPTIFDHTHIIGRSSCPA